MMTVDSISQAIHNYYNRRTQFRDNQNLHDFSKDSRFAEQEKHNRILLLIHVYGFEIAQTSMIDVCSLYDFVQEIDPSITTDDPDLDMFFRTLFDPRTFTWIYQYPKLKDIEYCYHEMIKGQS